MESRLLSQKEQNHLTRVGMVAAGFFSAFFLICTPQPIFTIFIGNFLTDTQSNLGIIVAAISFSAIFHIVSLVMMNFLASYKKTWIITTLIHRSMYIVLIFVAYFAKNEAIRQDLFIILLFTMVLSWIIASIGGSCWWAWMSHLVDEKTSGVFFARRGYVSSIVNMIVFVSVTMLLDIVPEAYVYEYFSIVFLIGTICGILNVLVQIQLPDVRVDKPKTSLLKNLAEPLQDRVFIRFIIASFLLYFALSLSGTFIGPYVTSKTRGLGIPATWLGIQFIIRQTVWTLASKFWGVLMDRFGRKPIVLMGMFTFFAWGGLFFLDKTTYMFILPLQGLIGGFFGFAIFEGIQAWMLSIASKRKSFTYSTWFWGVHGVSTGIGAITGGLAFTILSYLPITLFGRPVHPLLILVTISLTLFLGAFLLLLSVHQKEGKSFGYVLARISNPGIFRTYINMGVLQSTAKTKNIENILYTLRDHQTSLALDEIVLYLNDPLPEIREAAVRALGRTKDEKVLQHIFDEIDKVNSPTRLQAIKTLGAFKTESARVKLETLLQESKKDVQFASIYALAKQNNPESYPMLESYFNQAKNLELKILSAYAIAKQQVIGPLYDLLPLLHKDMNLAQMRLLALSIGGIIGSEQQFYKFLVGNPETAEKRFATLISLCIKNSASLWGKAGLRGHTSTSRATPFAKISSLIEDAQYHEAFQLCSEFLEQIIELDRAKHHAKSQYSIPVVFDFMQKFIETLSAMRYHHGFEQNARVSLLLLLYFFSVVKIPR